jgi:hypothetical protein
VAVVAGLGSEAATALGAPPPPLDNVAASCEVVLPAMLLSAALSTAAQGSPLARPEIISSPETRAYPSALGVGHIPNIRDLRAASLARRDEVAAQGVVAAAASRDERKIAVFAGGNQGIGRGPSPLAAACR